MSSMQRTQKGFTLIEVLIVVVIIGILASLILLGFGPTRQAARDARRVQDLRQVQHALELYFRRCGYYPAADDPSMNPPCGAAFDFSKSDPSMTSAAASWAAMSASLMGGAPPVLGFTTIPTDPDPGRSYRYAANADGSGYTLAADLEEPGSPLFTGSPGGRNGELNVNGVDCGGVISMNAPPGGGGRYCISF
jgi:prepilin-type N-terminal cleavage/methylation domain-containing protein